MHGPPEAEGSKLRISHPMFVPSNPDMSMRAKYAPDGPEPCTHPWDPVQYPAYQLCGRCGRVVRVHETLTFADD